ncbi:MAG TPA: twin-arginine translocation signal domain-containing protein [Bacteroidetes bacterium]|nr:twin-arginine translocation signal domain-containing protein [Bacteroidota bacterium]
MAEVNRREFLKSTAVTAGAVALGVNFVRPQALHANDTIRVAVVGIHGRGGSHIRGFARLPRVEVAAICDVDENVIAKRLKDMEEWGLPKPKTYIDIRKLLEDKDIDAISIATPNHWHALATIWACQAGKDVYVEKPGSHNVWEGRKMVEAARKYNRIVQHGTQARSSVAIKAAIEFLQSGGLGEVYMAKGICYKWRPSIGKVTKPQPVPKGVHYDLWLGPAPYKLPMRKRFHYDWHWFWDYGNGDIGNQGVHQMDIARWGLGVGFPLKVMAMGGHFMFDDNQETPNTMITAFEYPNPEGGGDKKKILQFEVRHWISNHEGGLGEGPSNSVGNLFFGSEGYMVVGNEDAPFWKTFMGKKREPGPYAKAGGDHFKNFIDAVRARDPKLLNAPIEEGHISSALCHLANISYRLGRSLDFDPQKEQFIGDEEANVMLTRKYREPYVVPENV